MKGDVAEKPVRRMGGENADTRQKLLEAAAKIVAEEGCAAVTARRLSEQLGLKRQIVFYYFRTIDDLLVTLIKRYAEALRQEVVRLAETDSYPAVDWQPDPLTQATFFEFLALSIRNESIRSEVNCYVAEYRQLHAELIARRIAERGVKQTVPPLAISMILTAVAQNAALEEAIDVTLGHEETQGYLDRWLAELLGERGGDAQ